MQSVLVRSDWGYWDELDGRALVDGDHVNVGWPDGTVMKNVQVVVVRSSFTVNDMGQPYTCPRVEAFIEVDHHGAKSLVRLGDNKNIKCELVEDS